MKIFNCFKLFDKRTFELVFNENELLNYDKTIQRRIVNTCYFLIFSSPIIWTLLLVAKNNNILSSFLLKYLPFSTILVGLCALIYLYYLTSFIAKEPFKTKNNNQKVSLDTHLQNELLLTKQAYLTELEKEIE